MKHVTSLSLLLASFAVAVTAKAEGPIVHAGAGVARDIGGPQSSELGTGAGGSAIVELPLARALGVQAGAGAIVLPKGDAPADPTFAERSTASVVFGAAGVRLHPISGLWMDANAGVAQTGSILRPTFDAHVGWDFRISDRGAWDVGPFVGYTQVVEPDSSLRPYDARIALAGIQVSLGGRAADRPKPPLPVEAPAVQEPALATTDHDGLPYAMDVCPAGMVEHAEDGCVVSVSLEGDQIVIGDVIHFELNSPYIRSVSFALLKRVARFIDEHSEIVEVDIEGHADARGTEAYNQVLSEARAESTRNLLVAYGVDVARLRPIGHGKRQLKIQTPLADLRNRRVEFTVVTKKTETLSRSVAVSSGTKGKP